MYQFNALNLSSQTKTLYRNMRAKKVHTIDSTDSNLQASQQREQLGDLSIVLIEYRRMHKIFVNYKQRRFKIESNV